MRIAFDELAHDGDEVSRLRLCWSRMEADLVGEVLARRGFDYAEERAPEGWSIFVAGSEAAVALAVLQHEGLDRTENVYNAGL
ncbi:MAG TPA: hypothetical protein VFP65_06730 [Anaeromyxobacteraceae bacterium]|nr:hypothetical protein [Anaeromyxobacteraceae bacterium]